VARVLAGACVPSAGRVTGRPRTGYVPERFPAGLPFSPRDYLTHLAALRGPGSTPVASDWLTGLPLLVALALVAVSWLAATLLAARRG
jgi:hypothetical protein